MSEQFRFPDELVAEGLAKCSTIEQATEFARAIAVMEVLANLLMTEPPPRRRRWWRR